MTDPDPADPLITEIRGMRSDLAVALERLDRERVGRRTSRQLAGAAISTALLVGGFFGASYVRDGRVTCETRTRSRAETRAAIGVAVDEGAVALGADDSQRTELRDRVDARVLEAYPPPSC